MNLTIEIGETLPSIEKRVIKATFIECGYNRKETAKVLGISLRTLYRKLDSLDLREEIFAEMGFMPRGRMKAKQPKLKVLKLFSDIALVRELQRRNLKFYIGR